MVTVAACSESEPSQTGGLGEPCRADGGCDFGLACVASRCRSTYDYGDPGAGDPGVGDHSGDATGDPGNAGDPAGDAAVGDAGDPGTGDPGNAGDPGDPGGCKSLAGLVLINEINPNEWSPASTSDTTNLLSFVELRGVPTTSLDGAELWLRNGSPAGGHTSGSPISLEGQTIPADGLWVVGEADVAPRDLALDSLTLQNGPDNVVLVDGCGATVDAVGYGTFDPGETFEGEGTAVAMPSGDGTTLGRRPGATLAEADTDDNSADFCVITPAAGGQAANAGLANPDPTGAEMTCP